MHARIHSSIGVEPPGGGGGGGVPRDVIPLKKLGSEFSLFTEYIDVERPTKTKIEITIRPMVNSKALFLRSLICCL